MSFILSLFFYMFSNEILMCNIWVSIKNFKDLELNVRHADLLYLLEPSCVIEAHTLI